MSRVNPDQGLSDGGCGKDRGGEKGGGVGVGPCTGFAGGGLGATVPSLVTPHLVPGSLEASADR